MSDPENTADDEAVTGETPTPGLAGRSVVHMSAQQLRTVAHPLRARLLGELRGSGPATATKLADALGTNTGATSYHLRRLAAVGLVAEDESLAIGRQRWWRALHEFSSFSASDYADDPDAAEAFNWMRSFHMRTLVEKYEEWEAVEGEYPSSWRDASGASDAVLTISPDRLRRLDTEIRELIDRYHAEGSESDPDALPVLFSRLAVPMVRAIRHGQGEAKHPPEGSR